MKSENDAIAADSRALKTKRAYAASLILQRVSSESQSLLDAFIKQSQVRWYFQLSDDKLVSVIDLLSLRCACDGSSRPKRIDPYGYHSVGCKIGANAIRLHDEVVAMVAKLFRTLRLDAIVEPTRLFNNADEDASNQRSDVFISY